MDRKKSVCQFMAKILVIIMVLQGMPLWELGNAYKWEFNPGKLQKILDVISIFVPSEAWADFKRPAVITETVTVNNKKTVYVHNVVQGTKTVTSPENRTVTTVYDRATLLTDSVSVPGLFDTVYGYDTRGRLKSVKIGTRETLFEYDSRGNLDYFTDPESRITYFDYDVMGRVKEIHRPDMTDLYFDYDLNGNMEILTVPKPEDRTVDHSFGYNSVNLKSSYTTPMNKSYGYTYDRDRRLTGKRFPSGDEINYVYEPGKNRLEQIQTPEGNIDYTYHPCGTNLETIAKGDDTVTYEYDGHLMTKETLTGTLNQTLSYEYNNDFVHKSFTYAGSTVTYAYDDDGLLTGAGNFTITRKLENGLPEAVTDGNLNLVRTFNGYGETESHDYTVDSQEKYSWSVTRDDNGRIRTKNETADGKTSEYVYDYDSMGRLLSVKDENGTLLEEYRYDPNGTRNYEMNAHREIAGRDITYQDDDCLMSAGDTRYEYDTDGFLERKTDASGETQYEYSSRGELLSVTLPDGTFIEYSHDPLGRRIAKKKNSVIVEKYLWQGRTRLLAVYDASDSLVMRFEYADGRMPVSMSTNGSVYYLSYDQVGSLRIVTDISGKVIKKLGYDSFGNIYGETNPSFEIPFGFAGGLYDRDTGLVRFGFRDYDPDVGRWTAKDPIGFSGGDTDLYGYCINDPINAVDPWGLMSETDCSWLEPFIEGQITITNNYKDIASGTYNNSYKQFIILRRNTETIADASGYKSEAYDNMPCEVQHIVDIHESYHQWHMPFLVSSILYLFNLNSWAEFIAAEEYRAHSISNRLLNELYEKECKK